VVEIGEGGAGGGAVSVSELWLVVDEVRFVTGEHCDAPGETEHDLPAPGVVDAAALVVTVLAAALPSEDYCRLRVRLDRAGSGAGGPDALEDHSLLVVGTTASGTPFRIRTRETPDLDIRSRGEPFALDAARADLILALDAARWLGDLDLERADRDDDGVIR